MVINNRIWVIGAVFVMVAILALGFFLGAAPRLDEVAKNETERQAVITQNEIQANVLAGLERDFENITEFTARLAELQKSIPSTNDLSTFIGELKVLEDKSGVVLTNFASGDGEPFVLDLGLPEPEAPAEEEGEEGAEGEETEAPAAPAVPEGTITQSLSPDEFVAIKIAMSVTGKQASILNFVNNLQNADRRFLVDSLRISSEDNKSYEGVIGGWVYVLIDPRTPVDSEVPVEEPEEEEAEPSSTPTPPVPTETPAP